MHLRALALQLLTALALCQTTVAFAERPESGPGIQVRGSHIEGQGVPQMDSITPVDYTKLDAHLRSLPAMEPESHSCARTPQLRSGRTSAWWRGLPAIQPANPQSKGMRTSFAWCRRKTIEAANGRSRYRLLRSARRCRGTIQAPIIPTGTLPFPIAYQADSVCVFITRALIRISILISRGCRHSPAKASEFLSKVPDEPMAYWGPRAFVLRGRPHPRPLAGLAVRSRGKGPPVGCPSPLRRHICPRAMRCAVVEYGGGRASSERN